MEAFEQALRATSRPWAPWYAIPADDKPNMRLEVAKHIVASLERLNPQYPTLPTAEAASLAGYADQLRAELGS
jgi:hypothetical protein